MTPSSVFYGETYKEIERRIAGFLNSQPEFLSARTASSPRAVGDAIQNLLSDHFQAILGGLCAKYSRDFARRSMADLAFSDADGFYYIVDVKTHRLDTSFNMPNLTSVERLARFYEDDTNYFVVLLINYSLAGNSVAVQGCHFVPIEFLSWDCLTVGALGWGQIQIANANAIRVLEGSPRKTWMVQLCDTMLDFYPREIAKIGGRIEYFERLKARWLERTG
jgi:hypothetical protein